MGDPQDQIDPGVRFGEGFDEGTDTNNDVGRREGREVWLYISCLEGGFPGRISIGRGPNPNLDSVWRRLGENPGSDDVGKVGESLQRSEPARVLEEGREIIVPQDGDREDRSIQGGTRGERVGGGKGFKG